MCRPFFLFLAFLIASMPVSGQVASTDSQTLQDLVAELRLLRQDLQMVAANSVRAQILLQRLRDQGAAAERATQRVDTLHDKLAEVQAERNHDAGDVKQQEDLLSQPDTSSAKRKQIEEGLAFSKRRVESLMSFEQELQARISEAEDQQRREQAKLDSLHAQVDRLLQSSDKASGHTHEP